MWIEELNNSDAGAQSRAAYHLFLEDPNSVRTDARASESLERLIDSSEPPPAAVLLASFAPTARTTELLLKVKKESGDQPAKLHPWSHPVRLRWSVDLALSRLGDSDARSALLESIDTATVDERLLLLD